MEPILGNHACMVHTVQGKPHISIQCLQKVKLKYHENKSTITLSFKNNVILKVIILVIYILT